MKICIVSLVLSLENDGKTYNTQDIGLGRAFATLGHSVQVIHFEKRKDDCFDEYICENLSLSHYKTKYLGNNTLNIKRRLPKDVDIMICFSDIQLGFPEVYWHCKKHKIKLFPIVGVISSHSSNKLIKRIMNLAASINLHLYRKLTILAKTTYVKQQLVEHRITDVHVTPVGLDTNALKDANISERSKLRNKYFPNIQENDSIILFVGRLIEKKRPFEALELFNLFTEKYPNSKMIFIGEGDLLYDLTHYIHKNGLTDKIKLFQGISNYDMWEFYIAADVLINCNRVEIFGMSILEAMYCECPVVAYAAPGPQMIITNKTDGYLYHTEEEALKLLKEAIMNGRLRQAKETILKNYSWINTANKIIGLFREHVPFNEG